MSGRIPQSFINDLLARVDIVDVIEQRMTLKKTGKNYSGLCPFHDEKTPSFSVSPDKQFYHCFGCQESGTALTFLINFDRLEFVEAVEALAAQVGVPVPREHTSRQRAPADPDLYHVLEAAERFYRQSLRTAPQAVEYLKRRGLTGEVARDFGIGYAPPGWQNLTERVPGVTAAQLIQAGLQIKNDAGRTYDRFRDRIMFPIRDTRGRVIGFGGRTLSADDGPKYLNSPETPVFQKGSELYGLYEARKALRRIDRLIVVEGYMDVVALAQHGVANAVATLGTATGEAHFHKLYRYADEVICCFDGDQAGRQAAWRALESALPSLNEHRQVKLVFLPDGEDPDSLIRSQGRAGFDRFIHQAMPGLEFLFARLAQGLDLDSVDGRARLAGLVSPYVEKVPAGVLRTLLEQKVRETTGLGATTQTPPRAPAVRRGGVSASSRLSERLLTLLLKDPQMWRAAADETRAGLLDAHASLGLLGQVLNYIEQHPQADTEEILAHWSDEPRFGELLERAQSRPQIGVDAMQRELVEGLGRLYQNLRNYQRRQALAALKQNPDDETFRRFMRSRGPDAQ